MIPLDEPLEPQDVLDRAQRAISRLQENPGCLSREERQMTLDALTDVQRFSASKLMRQEASQKKQQLAGL